LSNLQLPGNGQGSFYSKRETINKPFVFNWWAKSSFNYITLIEGLSDPWLKLLFYLNFI